MAIGEFVTHDGWCYNPTTLCADVPVGFPEKHNLFIDPVGEDFCEVETLAPYPKHTMEILVRS